MDEHSLERLDFPRVREILSGYALTGLGRNLALTVHPIARPGSCADDRDVLAAVVA